MSRTIRTVLGNLFHDFKDVDKDFHAIVVRKMWDTHFYWNKDSLGHMFAAHFEQTSHTELTALKNYVFPGTKFKPSKFTWTNCQYWINKVHLYFRPLRLKRPHRETRLIGRKRPHCNPRLRRRERPRCETDQKLIALQVPPLLSIHKWFNPCPSQLSSEA